MDMPFVLSPARAAENGMVARKGPVHCNGAGLVSTALAIKEDRAERARWQREWMEAERRGAEELEKRLEQKRRIQSLNAMVTAWEEGQRTRAFLAYVHESDWRPAQINGDGFEVWWDWTNEYAAGLGLRQNGPR